MLFKKLVDQQQQRCYRRSEAERYKPPSGQAEMAKVSYRPTDRSPTQFCPAAPVRRLAPPVLCCVSAVCSCWTKTDSPVRTWSVSFRSVQSAVSLAREVAKGDTEARKEGRNKKRLWRPKEEKRKGRERARGLFSSLNQEAAVTTSAVQ
jgi:hypothetical protein